MSKAQELADALDRMDNLLNPEYRLLSVPGDSATAIASRADMAMIRSALSSSSEQQAAQQDADTIALPRKEWEELQYYLDRCYDKGHLDQCFDLVEPLEALNAAIAARASNGGKA